MSDGRVVMDCNIRSPRLRKLSRDVCIDFKELEMASRRAP